MALIIKRSVTAMKPPAAPVPAAGRPAPAEKPLVALGKKFPRVPGGKRPPAKQVPPPPPEPKPDLAAALERAAEAEKIKDYFITTAGCDMRKSVDKLQSIVKRLREASLPPEVEGDVKSIADCARDLRQMADDLAAIAKIDPSDAESGRQPTDIATLVVGVVADFMDSARAKGISLTANVADMPKVSIDAHRLRQMIRLLVSSALVFTSDGRIGVEVSYFAEKLKILVEDTGCGMPVEAQEKFAALGASDEMEGETGKSLTMVKRLVFSLGGDISLRSTPGIGTVFTISLPGVRVFGDGERNFSSMQRIEAVDFTKVHHLSRAFRVLVVDSSPIRLAVAKGILAALGFTEIDTVSDASDALVKILTGAYGAIFTDMHTSGVDGATLVKEIRKIPSYGGLPVYVMTADDTVKARAAEMGFTDVLLKPITKEKFASVVG